MFDHKSRNNGTRRPIGSGLIAGFSLEQDFSSDLPLAKHLYWGFGETTVSCFPSFSILVHMTVWYRDCFVLRSDGNYDYAPLLIFCNSILLGPFRNGINREMFSAT